MEVRGESTVDELDEDRFWELIELVGDIRSAAEPYGALVAELARWPVADILLVAVARVSASRPVGALSPGR